MTSSVPTIERSISAVAILVGAVFVTFAVLPIADAANVSSSPRLAEYQNAALMAKVAETFNKRPFSQDVKNALIDQARSEDKDAVQRAIAGLRPAAEFRLVVDYDRLRGVDKKDRTIFVIESVPGNPSHYFLNGKEWSVPESGSIMKSISIALAKSSENAAGFFDRLLNALTPEAVAADASGSAPLAIYLYSQARGSALFPATAHLQGAHPENPLIRGIGFDTTSYVHDFFQTLKKVTVSSLDVQCHGGTAKGFAIIGGTEVAFEANENAELTVQADGQSQKVKFIPNTGSLDAFVSGFREAKKEYDLAKKSGDWRRKKKAGDTLIKRLDYVCREWKSVSTTPVPSLCMTGGIAKFDVLLDLERKQLARPKKKPNEPPPSEEKALAMAADEYLESIDEKFEFNSSELEPLLARVAAIKIVKPTSGVLTACKNDSCTQTADDSVVSILGDRYRIPPNKPDTAAVDAIRNALKFSATTKDGTPARIEYACEIKNASCQELKIVNGDRLPFAQFQKANELVNRANRFSRWRVDDPSVATPVHALRALGQCCLEDQCRDAMLSKGIKMKTHPRSNETETAR